MRLRRSGIAVAERTRVAGRGDPASRRQAGRAAARLVHERSAMDAQWSRSRRRAGARPRVHAGVSALQQRPSHLHQRARVRRAARSAGATLAGAADRARADRAQHGRPRRPQRLPLRRARAPRVAAACSTSSSSSARRITGRRSSAAATGSTCCWARAPTPRRWRASARSAARASPICVSATCVDEDWNKRDRFARGGDRREAVPLPEGVGVLRHRRHPRGRRPAISAAGCSATASCRSPARSAATRIRGSRWHSTSRAWVAYGTNHLDLLSRPEVYAQIRQWLAASD